MWLPGRAFQLSENGQSATRSSRPTAELSCPTKAFATLRSPDSRMQADLRKAGMFD